LEALTALFGVKNPVASILVIPDVDCWDASSAKPHPMLSFEATLKGSDVSESHVLVWLQRLTLHWLTSVGV